MVFSAVRRCQGRIEEVHVESVDAEADVSAISSPLPQVKRAAQLGRRAGHDLGQRPSRTVGAVRVNGGRNLTL
jgi:hypothetical protein